MNVVRLQSWLMFALLTVGYAVAHVVIALWVGAIVSSLWQGSSLYEYVQMTAEGEPIIRSTTWDGSRTEARTLDGVVISYDELRDRQIAMPAAVANSVRGEPSWSARLMPYQDGQSPAAYWYLVAPPEEPGTAYFIGYDSASRRPIGYLGVAGFSTQPPAPAQSFAVQASHHDPFQGFVASPQMHGRLREEPFGMSIYGTFDNAPVDAVWILSKDVLYEVRLRLRTVRPLLSNRPDMRAVMFTWVKHDPKSLAKLLVRTSTGLLSIDPESQEVRTLLLDLAAPPAWESILELNDGGWLVQTTRHDVFTPQRTQYNFVWYHADGQVKRRASAQTNNSNAVEVGVQFTATLSTVLPTPIIPALAMAVGPWVLPDDAEFATHSVRQGYLMTWLSGWLVISLAIGLLTGWACRLRERDVFGESSWVLPVLVGACGWFGWMAYICLRPLPTRLPHGGWLPAQPEPNRPLGTEIFA